MSKDTEIGWLAGLLQMTDKFYPTGAYAHSFGLEGLIEQGVVRDRETLRAFLIASGLPMLRQAELPLVIHMWAELGGDAGESQRESASQAAGGTQAGDERRGPAWETVSELARLASALKAAKEARTAAENIARQRVELVARLRGHELAQECVRRAEADGWPYSLALAAALEARVLGAPLEAALASVYDASIAGLLAAAMKLLRLGQNGCQTLLTEMLTHAPEIVAAAKRVPVDEIGWFNPWLDIAAARHERAAARLFILRRRAQAVGGGVRGISYSLLTTRYSLLLPA